MRCIALGDFGTEALRVDREPVEDRAKDAGVEITDETPILTYDLENPISPDTASHYVRDIADKAKIDTHLHALRHFAATQMVEAGRTYGRWPAAWAMRTPAPLSRSTPAPRHSGTGMRPKSLGKSLTPRKTGRGRAAS